MGIYIEPLYVVAAWIQVGILQASTKENAPEAATSDALVQ